MNWPHYILPAVVLTLIVLFVVRVLLVDSDPEREIQEPGIAGTWPARLWVWLSEILSEDAQRTRLRQVPDQHASEKGQSCSGNPDGTRAADQHPRSSSAVGFTGGELEDLSYTV
jgi:hypothetical protein